MSSLGGDADGSYAQYLSELTDIRARYQAILRSSSICVIFLNDKGDIVSPNEKLLHFLQHIELTLSETDIFYEFFRIRPEEDPSVLQRLKAGLLNEFSIELSKKLSSGSSIRFRSTLSICRRENGSFLNYVVVIEELPGLIDNGLSQTRQLNDLLQDAPVGFGFLRGSNFIIEMANRNLLHIWGKTESVIGMPILEGLPEIKEQPFPNLLRQVFESGEAYYGNETPAYLDRERPREEGFYNFVYHPVKDEKNNVSGILVVVTEVSEMVKAKEELKRSERRFRELIESADVSVAVYRGRELTIELANDSMLNLWGKGPEVRGMLLRDALPELEGQPFFGLLEKVYDTGIAYKATRDPGDIEIDGKLERFYFNFSYKPMFDLDGKVYAILNMAIDVTENVEAGKKLEESEHKMRMIIDAAELGTYELDYRTNILTFSNRLRHLFGLKEDAPANHQTLISMLHPEDREIRETAHLKALKSGTFEYTARIIQPSGIIKWLRFSGKVRKDQNNSASHLYGIAMDLTAAKQEEIRKNSFISMASHELKTPLTTIKGYVQLLKLEAKKNGSDFLRTVLGKTEKQANKMIKMVTDFLDLSKIETNNFKLKIESFNVASLIDEIIEETKMISGFNNIVTCFEYKGDMRGDRERLSQVLTNFLNNAIKYARKGQITVNVSLVDEKVTVSVTDEGPGIKPEDREKIFDKYYRVENVNNANIAGFGIGLYICAEIIRMHGGEIGVSGEDDKGSTFYFALKP